MTGPIFERIPDVFRPGSGTKIPLAKLGPLLRYFIDNPTKLPRILTSPEFREGIIDDYQADKALKNGQTLPPGTREKIIVLGDQLQKNDVFDPKKTGSLGERVDFNNKRSLNELVRPVDATRDPNLRNIDLLRNTPAVMNVRTLNPEHAVMAGVHELFQSNVIGPELNSPERLRTLNLMDNVVRAMEVGRAGKHIDMSREENRNAVRFLISVQGMIDRANAGGKLYDNDGVLQGEALRTGVLDPVSNLLVDSAKGKRVEESSMYAGREAEEAFSKGLADGKDPASAKGINIINFPGQRVLVVNDEAGARSAFYKMGLFYSGAKPEMVISVSKDGVAINFSQSMGAKNITNIQGIFTLLFGYIYAHTDSGFAMSGRVGPGQQLNLKGNVSFDEIFNTLNGFARARGSGEENSSIQLVQIFLSKKLPQLQAFLEATKNPVFEKMIISLLQWLLEHAGEDKKQISRNSIYSKILKDFEQMGKQRVAADTTRSELNRRQVKQAEQKEEEGIVGEVDKDGKRKGGEEQKKNEEQQSELGKRLIPFAIAFEGDLDATIAVAGKPMRLADLKAILEKKAIASSVGLSAENPMDWEVAGIAFRVDQAAKTIFAEFTLKSRDEVSKTARFASRAMLTEIRNTLKSCEGYNTKFSRKEAPVSLERPYLIGALPHDKMHASVVKRMLEISKRLFDIRERGGSGKLIENLEKELLRMREENLSTDPSMNLSFADYIYKFDALINSIEAPRAVNDEEIFMLGASNQRASSSLADILHETGKVLNRASRLYELSDKQLGHPTASGIQALRNVLEELNAEKKLLMNFKGPERIEHGQDIDQYIKDITLLTRKIGENIKTLSLLLEHDLGEFEVAEFKSEKVGPAKSVQANKALINQGLARAFLHAEFLKTRISDILNNGRKLGDDLESAKFLDSARALLRMRLNERELIQTQKEIVSDLLKISKKPNALPKHYQQQLINLLSGWAH